MVIEKFQMPNFFDASSSESAVRARSSAKECNPKWFANATPVCSLLLSGTAGKVPSNEPLSPIAPAIKFFDKGEAMWALTETEPADSPAIVTLFGSPPKALILLCTQRRAAADDLEILSTLVEAYEQKHYPVPPPHPLESIRFSIEQGQLDDKELTKIL